MPLVAQCLVPTEYEKWRDHQIREYARDKVANGAWSEAEALTRATADHESLLPDGLATLGHHIRRIVNSDTMDLIGYFWVGRASEGPPGLAWLYDIEIEPAHRGQGHGRAAMTLVESAARELGCHRLGLHVFATNTTARRLYESCGYTITNYNYAKDL
jgi:ribosomal protein S18 acetylase RimI-like enzyme